MTTPQIGQFTTIHDKKIHAYMYNIGFPTGRTEELGTAHRKSTIDIGAL